MALCFLGKTLSWLVRSLKFSINPVTESLMVHGEKRSPHAFWPNSQNYNGDFALGGSTVSVPSSRRRTEGGKNKIEGRDEPLF